MVMAADLDEPSPAVSDDHGPDLLEQRLDGGSLASGRQCRQVMEIRRLTRAPNRLYLVFYLSRYGQWPDCASLGHEGIMPREAVVILMEGATERSH